MNPRQADEERFGFRWGQVVVTRLAELPKKQKVIGIGTGGIATRPEIEVYVSKTGRSIRVFRNGKELQEAEDG